MTALKHADVIVHMAKHGFDSVEREFPGVLEKCWLVATDGDNPVTLPDEKWRIKPTTITYTVTVPEPLRVMPEVGDKYWSVVSDRTIQDVWADLALDQKRFALGNIWDTKAKARQAFDALFGPLKAKG
jgi:hypothetical protein